MKRMIWASVLILLTLNIYGCAKPPSIPITEMNTPELLGRWKGTGAAWFEVNTGQMADVTMDILSVDPVQAEIKFYILPMRRGAVSLGEMQKILTFEYSGKIEDGYIKGEVRGKPDVAVTFGFYEKRDGRIELRGGYRFVRRDDVSVIGDLILKKIPETMQ